MTNRSKLEMGKTYYPKKQHLDVSDTLVRGAGWKAEKLADRYFFEFLAARHGGGVDRYELTKDEFDMVRDGKLSFDDLILMTDRDPARHPIKSP
ncbi:hypothetical protein [Nitrincola sp. MINF-07-Sa-05]|uniref:hypothetical protein n=1 Tax=Nitrincola salilacus TaxID=3400273 RepID=UPI003917D4E9